MHSRRGAYARELFTPHGTAGRTVWARLPDALIIFHKTDLGLERHSLRGFNRLRCRNLPSYGATVEEVKVGPRKGHRIDNNVEARVKVGQLVSQLGSSNVLARNRWKDTLCGVFLIFGI